MYWSHVRTTKLTQTKGATSGKKMSVVFWRYGMISKRESIQGLWKQADLVLKSGATFFFFLVNSVTSLSFISSYVKIRIPLLHRDALQD